VAVGLVILLFKGTLVKLFKAEGADEMFWVELAEHGRDTPT